jgi:hypothetical protein
MRKTRANVYVRLDEDGKSQFYVTEATMGSSPKSLAYNLLDSYPCTMEQLGRIGDICIGSAGKPEGFVKRTIEEFLQGGEGP